MVVRNGVWCVCVVYVWCVVYVCGVCGVCVVSDVCGLCGVCACVVCVHYWHLMDGGRKCCTHPTGQDSPPSENGPSQISIVWSLRVGLGFSAMFIDVKTEITPPSACHDLSDLFLSLAASWGFEALGKLVTVKTKDFSSSWGAS